MFQSIYELFLGSNDDPIYVDSIFTPVGTMTTLVALGVAAVFYVALGRWKPVFHRTVHWVLTLVGTLVFAWFYALWFAKDQTGADEADSYMTGFGGVNVLLAAILFFLFSLLLKQASIFAKRTPF
jgi:hypothetical protein